MSLSVNCLPDQILPHCEVLSYIGTWYLGQSFVQNLYYGQNWPWYDDRPGYPADSAEIPWGVGCSGNEICNICAHNIILFGHSTELYSVEFNCKIRIKFLFPYRLLVVDVELRI